MLGPKYARENTRHSSEVSVVVPCDLHGTASDDGFAIRGNPDTINTVFVILVDKQGLASLDVPHPEW